MAGGSGVCARHRSPGGFRVDTRLRRPGVPNPGAGTPRFPCHRDRNSLQRCATAKSRNFLMNPVLDLFLDHFLNLISRLRIPKKVFDEFVVLLRLCIDPFGSFGEHLVGTLSGRTLVSSGTAESFFDFCAKAVCAILGIHLGYQSATGNLDIPEDRVIPAWNLRVSFLAPIKNNTV